ncbi:MAG: hypothetical protein GC192_01010 [Bacteroidetes bacterium]|nr:hypothetical protein [Bacteroidota bacterium]
MPNSITKIFHPAYYARTTVGGVTLGQMDALLANGYYRNGVDICAASVRSMGNIWVSAVMLRVRLSDFVWKKRLRKLLRTNSGKFDFEFRPFQPTTEMETLWQQYKDKVHGWHSVPSLAQHILRGKTADDFNTWQLCVFSQGKLVAFSVFDRGLHSIASLEAAYDTEFSKYSLGVYTMLLEITWCQGHGLDYYYPGFYPENDPMFDYKLRPGNIEFFRVENGAWLPIDKLVTTDWKLAELVDRHRAVQEVFQSNEIQFTIAFNHSPFRPDGQPNLCACSLQIIVPIQTPTGQRLVFVHWNLSEKLYDVFSGTDLTPMMRKDALGNYLPHHFYSVKQVQYFGSFQTPVEVVLLAQKIKEQLILTVS